MESLYDIFNDYDGKQLDSGYNYSSKIFNIIRNVNMANVYNDDYLVGKYLSMLILPCDYIDFNISEEDLNIVDYYDIKDCEVNKDFELLLYLTLLKLRRLKSK